MVKKLLTLVFGLALAIGANAQSGNYPYSQSNIQFWTGSGSNSAVVVISWDDEDASYTPTGFAWGVHFNGTVTARNLLDTIAAYDSRFTFSFSNTMLSTIAYHDTVNNVHLTPSIQYNCYNVNGAFAQDVYDYIYISDGDMMEISESCYFDCTNITPATNPNAGSSTTDAVDATIAFEDILYWVGNGSNEAILAVNWPDTALAWGYRFGDGNVSVNDMLNDIAAADPRFSIVNGAWGIDDILFVENGDTLRKGEFAYWSSTNNGVMDMGIGQTLANGDLEKWAESTTGVLVDSNWVEDYGGYWNYTYVYPMTIHPVSVPEVTPEDATITADEIRYWVGEGENEIIFVVNWATKAYAWGYRFASDSVSLAAVMDDIAAADSRFAYTGAGFVNDITYNDGTESLAITTGNYWSHFLNSLTSDGMASYLHDGDFSRWADPAAGVLVDSNWVEDYGGYWNYTYVYPMTITPVEPPYVAGPFCGAVGTEGCNAIPANSELIIAWATTCTVERGPQNISVEGSPMVTYGSDSAAIGACSMSDNLSVVSLGDGGMATVTFAEPIVNGEGPDFAVFENSFNDFFLELAFVEVSSDGERFVRFPATSLTQTEVQVEDNVDPTYINNLAGKFRMGYGTPFDLNELRDSAGLDINAITHVRVIDVVGSIDPQYATYDAAGNIINDPWPTNSYSSGFDLDGVAVLAHSSSAIDEVEAGELSLYPNPVAEQLTVESTRATVATLYDLNGRRLGEYTLAEGRNIIDLGAYAAGIYILRAEGTAYKLVKH